MPDYSNGKIYTIRCKNDVNLKYVGSTTQPLAKRWWGHKVKSSYKPNYLIYKTINNEWDNWYIELYENFPCNSKEELNKREGEVIREIGNLNKRIEGRTKQEYREANKEKTKEYMKEYREANKEILREIKKEYREKNKDTMKEYKKQYYIENKDKVQQFQKQYREKNKEKAQQYNKEYREKNNEKLQEIRKKKVICECGCEITKTHLNRHKKSEIHKKIMNSLKQD